MKRLSRLSIGMRLTLWYLAIFLLAEFIFGAGMWLILRKNLYDIADAALEGQAADIERFLEARKGASAEQLHAEISEDYKIERSEDYLQITDAGGKTIYRSRFLDEHSLPPVSLDQLKEPVYENLKLGKLPFRILSERMEINGQVFVVQIGSTLDEETETLDAFRKYLLMFAPVGAWGQTVKIAPPLTIPLEAMQEGLAVLAEATDEAVAAQRAGAE